LEKKGESSKAALPFAALPLLYSKNTVAELAEAKYLITCKIPNSQIDNLKLVIVT